MPRTRGRAPAGGRADALSREIVVGAAVALLDELGERGLTFRALAQRLNTGTGALYWHVAGKDELVALAADQVLGRALTSAPVPAADPDPAAASAEGPASTPAAASADGSASAPAEEALAELRALALAVFDELDRHPWAASRVTTPPTLPNALRLQDGIGMLVTRAGAPPERRFAVSTAVFYYITGVGAQIIAPSVTVAPSTDRETYLARTAEHWESLDPAEYPFLTGITADLRDHDDRDQFITGLDLLLDGLGRPRP
ncbi:TetR family transcriptional regulator [Actinomadura gamaensis]|uniref:TetR family transcriptional regulator n=1 Tax=Actinomadura gamaensis TaxID=1763541 RepID=A0ABV9UBC9_9ACTN